MSRTVRRYPKPAIRRSARGERCECSDHACPEHPGRDCGFKAQATLRRVDMNGARVRACFECAADMLECGLFAEGR